MKMNDTDEGIFYLIQQLVWSGFYSTEDIQHMISDNLEMGCNEALLRQSVEPEFAKKRDAEKGWPKITDCDYLATAFATLDNQGILCLDLAGNTMSDGQGIAYEIIHDLPQGHYFGYCFYHSQDLDRAMVGEGLLLGFGHIDDDASDIDDIKVGSMVKSALEKVGFELDWDGTAEQRIFIPRFDWKRRQRNFGNNDELEIRTVIQQLLDYTYPGKKGGFVIFGGYHDLDFVQFALEPNGLILNWPTMQEGGNERLPKFLAHLEQRKFLQSPSNSIDDLRSGQFVILEDGLNAQVGRDPLKVSKLAIELLKDIFGVTDLNHVRITLEKIGYNPG